MTKALSQEPSEWLRQHEDLLVEQPKDRALDVATGNGRNAFHLARLGFTVEAVDISDVAIDRITGQVHQQKLPIHPELMDLERISLPTERYQVIVNMNYLERSIFSAIKNALVPGGLLFFETFTRDHIDVLGIQLNRNYTLDHNELLTAFRDLRILAYREAIVARSPDRKRAVASLVARKIA